MYRSTLRRYGEIASLVLLGAVVLRLFVLQGYRIASSSMLPTMMAGDHVVVSKLHYGVRAPVGGGCLFRYRSPRPGDIVVFAVPADVSMPGGRHHEYVKRVAAVPGELVEMRGGELLVDGRRRELEGAAGEEQTARHHGNAGDFGPRRVPTGQVFVLGDNRVDSHDSREWGFVPLDSVIGRAVLILWSWDYIERAVRWDRVWRWLR